MSPRPIQEPTERPGTFARHDAESKAYTHPAFGMIGVSRVTGGTETLHGSDIVHHGYMMIRVARSELHRDLSRDWHHARDNIVEVMLSEAQWATFVSSPNIGDGVPCTLARVNGEQMPGIPERRQQDVYASEFARRTEELAARVDATIAKVEGDIGAALSKAKRESVLADLRRVRMEIHDNMPFVARSFTQHMEGTVEAAKAEVHAYVTGHVMRAGLASIANGTAEPLQLGPGEAPHTHLAKEDTAG